MTEKDCSSTVHILQYLFRSGNENAKSTKNKSVHPNTNNHLTQFTLTL